MEGLNNQLVLCLVNPVSNQVTAYLRYQLYRKNKQFLAKIQ